MIALLLWIWSLVAPWLVWFWWALLAPLLQGLLHCCGILWLGERAVRWWSE